MLQYKLLNWQGTYPRPTGKGVVVLNGINLIQFEIGRPSYITYIKIDPHGNQYIDEERNDIDPFKIATNKLLNHLKKIHHIDFKFMKVVDLTIGDERKDKPCGMEW